MESRQNWGTRHYGATELTAYYRTGEPSSVTVVSDTLDAIENFNPAINAFTQVTADSTVPEGPGLPRALSPRSFTRGARGCRAEHGLRLRDRQRRPG